MAQKPTLRVEVYARALRASQKRERELLGHRVSQGIEKFIPALKAIRDHHDVIVPNLGTRKGHRAVVVPG